MRATSYCVIGIILTGAALAGCAGRVGHPVNIAQPNDKFIECAQIMAEIKANNEELRALGREKGWKMAQNITAGVVGIVVWPVWFGMDFKGAAAAEARALSQRNEYLASLAKKRCR